MTQQKLVCTKEKQSSFRVPLLVYTPVTPEEGLSVSRDFSSFPKIYLSMEAKS